MKKIYLLIYLVIVGSSVVMAQATRTWVSGVGDDANPCSRTAPCKTFAGAISKTAAGGEISALDPGGYGAVTITKAITINGDGTLAGILAASTNGIVVNAGANDVVTIRSISINGTGTGLNGIRYIGGAKVHIENCTIEGFTTSGVDVSLTASGVLTMKKSTITTISGTGIGIKATTTTGTANLMLDNIYVQGNPTGIQGNANSAIYIDNSVISDNTTGIWANNATSVIRVSNTSVINNSTGVTTSSTGKVYSFGNNKIAGNTSNTPMSVISTQ